VLTVMKIAAALERAGDYAKNLAKRTPVLAQMPVVPGASGAIRRSGEGGGADAEGRAGCLYPRDVKLAEDVRKRDKEVDQMYNALFREFLTHMMEDPRNIGPCMHLHFIAKNIERVGDHATSSPSR
jgi:phosphate transport system protein